MYYNNYVLNLLNTAKKVGGIGALCEGGSVRSIERTTGVHRDNVCAWIHSTERPARPKRHVPVLHIPPFVSPQAAIVRELRENGKAN
jgi:hypothetical protein